MLPTAQTAPHVPARAPAHRPPRGGWWASAGAWSVMAATRRRTCLLMCFLAIALQCKKQSHERNAAQLEAERTHAIKTS